MTLSDYLQAAKLTDADFAARIGVSQSTINRARRGLMNLDVDTALAIEAETGGQVDAAVLSADVRKARASCTAVDRAATAAALGPIS